MAGGTFAIGSLALGLAGSTSTSSKGSGISPGYRSNPSNILNLQSITVFSVGLIVSTALAVVIPEGVEVLLRSIQTGKEGEGEGEAHEHYQDSEHNGISGYVGLALCSGFLLMYVPLHSGTYSASLLTRCTYRVSRFCIHQYGSHSHVHHSSQAHGNTKVPKDLEQGQSGLTRRPSEDQLIPNDSTMISDSTNSDYFSVASSQRHGHSDPSARTDPLDSKSPMFSTFLGLLFHALADGISLGAASTFSSAESVASRAGHESSGEATGLSFLIFLSLIIHKAPVAFSLPTLLLSSTPANSIRSVRSQVRKALVLFSLSTPVGAIFTWVFLKLLILVTWSESLEDGKEEDGNIDGGLVGNMRGRLEFWSEHM